MLIVAGDLSIKVNGVDIEWDLPNGKLNFLGTSSTLFWNDPSLLNMFKPLVDEVGREMFDLQVAYSSSKGTEQDYHVMVTQLGDTFEEGFLNWGKAVSGAGWGLFSMPEFSEEKVHAKVVVTNPWELEMQRALTEEERWGCPFLKGKIIGIFNHALNTNCWAEQSFVIDEYSSRVEFTVHAHNETIEEKLRLLRQSKERLEVQKLKQKIEEASSELRAAKEAAESANVLKSEFLANMSHEIRTPMNAILGFIHILSYKETDPEKKEMLSIVEESSQGLLAIINDILDFSRIEQGAEKIDLKPNNAGHIIGSLIALFTDQAQKKNITLTSRIENRVPDCVLIDEVRFKQVLTNLLSNAIKFTQNNGMVVVHLDYVNGCLHCSVQDNGVGIPEDKLKSIFNAFEQVDGSSTRKYGGTGLGLSIASSLVCLMGGQLQVESDVGKGSRFWFAIDVKNCSQTDSNSLDNSAATPAKEILKNLDMHVLVVEDNSNNQLVIKLMLDEVGISYDLVEDGTEAVEVFKPGLYDAILMDENMPNMNGIQACKLIRILEKSEAARSTPIIAMTANALKEDRQRFLDSGMDEYISKPFNQEELVRVLKLFK